jgi:hypothetical protein
VACGTPIGDVSPAQDAVPNTNINGQDGSPSEKGSSNGDIFSILVYGVFGILILIVGAFIFSYSFLLGLIFILAVGFCTVSFRRSRGSHTAIEADVLERTDRFKDSIKQGYQRGEHREFAKNVRDQSQHAVTEAHNRYKDWEGERAFNKNVSDLHALLDRCESFFIATGIGATYFRGWIETYDFELQREDKDTVRHLIQVQDPISEGLDQVQLCRRLVDQAGGDSAHRERTVAVSEGVQNTVTDTINEFHRLRETLKNLSGWNEYQRQLDDFLSEFVHIPDSEEFSSDQNSYLEGISRKTENEIFRDPHRVPGTQGMSTKRTVASAIFFKSTTSDLPVLELLRLMYETVDEVDRAGYWEGHTDIRESVRSHLIRSLSLVALANRVGEHRTQEQLPDIELAKLDILYEVLSPKDRKTSDYGTLAVKFMSSLGNYKAIQSEVPDYLHALVAYDRDYGSAYCVAMPVIVEHLARNMSHAGGPENGGQDMVITGHIGNLKRFLNLSGFSDIDFPYTDGIVTVDSSGIKKITDDEARSVETLSEDERDAPGDPRAATIGTDNGNILLTALNPLLKMADAVERESHWQGNVTIGTNLFHYGLRFISYIAAANGELEESDVELQGHIHRKITGRDLERSRLRERIRDFLKGANGFSQEIPDFLKAFAEYDRSNESNYAAAAVSFLNKAGVAITYSIVEGDDGERRRETLEQILTSQQDFLRSAGVPEHYEPRNNR